MAKKYEILTKKGIAIRGTIYYKGDEKKMPELTPLEEHYGTVQGKLKVIGEPEEKPKDK